MCSCDGFSRGSVAGRPALHAPGACGLVAVVLAAAIELKGTQERVTSLESTEMNRLLHGWNFSDQPHRHDRHATRVSPARGQNRCCKGAEASPDLSTAVRSGRKRAVAPRAALSSFCAGAAEAPPVTGGPARWLGRDTELAADAVTGSCAAAAASAKVWTTMIDCPALHMC